MLWALIVVLTTLAAWGCGQLFQPRAAFLQVGAMLGTIMAGNVFFNIIPAHWELINAKKAGREPDPTPGIIAKQALGPQQLLHPAGAVHDARGALRVRLRRRPRLARADRDHAARRPGPGVLQPAPPGPDDLGHSRRSVSSACSCSPGRSSRTTPASGSTATTVAFAQVAPVIEQRCAPCHAQTPTEPGFSSPPAGVVLETPEQIAARANDIKTRRLDEGDAARQSHEA